MRQKPLSSVAETGKKPSTSKSVRKKPKVLHLTEIEVDAQLVAIPEVELAPSPNLDLLNIVNLKIEDIDPSLQSFYTVSLSENSFFASYLGKVGFRVPIVVAPAPQDSNFLYKVIDGASRLAIARAHGYTEVPCIVVEDNSKEALLRIGLNTTRVKSRYEYYLELVELKKLLGFGQGFRADIANLAEENKQILHDLTKLVGSQATISSFSSVSRGLEDLHLKGSQDDKIRADEIFNKLRDGSFSPTAAKKLIQSLKDNTQSGSGQPKLSSPLDVEVILSGPSYHLIQGDCRDASCYNLAEKSVQCIFTSPPYLGANQVHYDGSTIADNCTTEDFVKSLADCFESYLPYLTDDHTIWVNLGDFLNQGAYVCSTHYFVLEMLNRGFRMIDEIIWSKPTPNPMRQGAQYHSVRSHEYVFVFTKSQNIPYYRPTQVMENNIRMRNVFPFSVNLGVSQGGSIWHMEGAMGMKFKLERILGVAFNHPAMMPYALPYLALKSSTRENSIVLDPFCGQSGAVGVATLELGMGRRFIGIDQSTEYLNGSALVLDKFLHQEGVSMDTPLVLESEKIAA